jgi:tetratricopeptide (TPR) repeat protein
MSDFEVSDQVKRIAKGQPAATHASDEVAEQQRALEAAENTFGCVSIQAAGIFVNLGGVYRSAGRLAEAHKAYVRALEITEEILGPDHAELARIYHCLAELELTRGRFVTGEPYARRSLEICQGTPGVLGADLAKEMKLLAVLLAGQGRSAESELLQRSADAVFGSTGDGFGEATSARGSAET